MVKASVFSLLIPICRLLSQIFRRQVISTTSLLRRLSYLPSLLFSRLFLWREGPRTDKLSSSQRGQLADSQKQPRHRAPEEPKGQTACSETPTPTPYTVTENGETVSLEGTVASTYPFSNGNIRNTSHESFISRLTDADSSVDIPLHPIPVRSHFPAPRLQYSASAPHLRRVDIPERNPTVNIQIVSPSTNSQSSRRLKPHRPVLPSETRRYKMRTKILKKDTNLTIGPMSLDYSKPIPPGGWIKYAHPEGAQYFCHESKKVYTDSEIHDPEILSYLEEDITTLKALSTSLPTPFPETAEFVINVYRTSEDAIESEYYCVDHDTRLVFFLAEFEAQWMEAWHEIPGVTSAAQLHIELQAQYWFFVQLFPSSIQLTKEMICELRDIVLHLIGDSMTSPYSTACFTLDTLYKILGLTNELDKNVGLSCGAMCFLARQMYMFTHSRFLNFHGESSARIERNFSVYDDKTHNRRTWLIKTLSFVLFSAPDVHLITLQKMWVDKIMHKSVWEESMKKMNDEWQEFIFFASVVLNSNVAFLAIQTVDVNNHPYRSPAQIASYLSIVANIASIILGLLLMRQNRTKHRETADDVQRFLARRNHPRLGLESLAILYSLPYALLMWGMVAFLAAFAFNCFEDANLSTRSLVGSGCFAMVILTLWCISVSWEEREQIDNRERQLAYLDPENENFPIYDEELRQNDNDDEMHEEDANTVKLTSLGVLWNLYARVRPIRLSCDLRKPAVRQTSDV